MHPRIAGVLLILSAAIVGPGSLFGQARASPFEFRIGGGIGVNRAVIGALLPDPPARIPVQRYLSPPDLPGPGFRDFGTISGFAELGVRRLAAQFHLEVRPYNRGDAVTVLDLLPPPTNGLVQRLVAATDPRPSLVTTSVRLRAVVAERGRTQVGLLGGLGYQVDRSSAALIGGLETRFRIRGHAGFVEVTADHRRVAFDITTQTFRDGQFAGLSAERVRRPLVGLTLRVGMVSGVVGGRPARPSEKRRRVSRDRGRAAGARCEMPGRCPWATSGVRRDGAGPAVPRPATPGWPARRHRSATPRRRRGPGTPAV